VLLAQLRHAYGRSGFGSCHGAIAGMLQTWGEKGGLFHGRPRTDRSRENQTADKSEKYWISADSL